MEIANIILEYLKVLIWPVTVFTLAIIFRKQVENILSRIKKAELPGGISIETFPKQIEEAKVLSKIVKEEKQLPKMKEGPVLPLNEVNTKMLNLGLIPSSSGLNLSYYRILAEKDTALALAGLRIEIETMLRNVAKGFKVQISKRDTISILVKKLLENGAITYHQAELITSVTQLSNAAVHGLNVTFSQAIDILSIADVLRDYYISWLSWGFIDK
ncbi:MAG: hypothetical protein KAR83_03445 [Thermodesulfovibrionales bacterium]|nr:hypothetical protein [Thermodesulfovibrionales bacterium]